MSQGSGPPPADAARAKHDHHWESVDYVRDWIARDGAREESRKIWLERMIAATPFAQDSTFRVIDIGGGTGALSGEILAAFPNAQVTLHDYSDVMFAHAKRNLAVYGNRLRFARADMRDPSWIAQVGGPFDLAVSSLCVHNFMDMALIGRCYGDIRRLLVPGGCFLDYDHYEHIETMAAHLALFEHAGYAAVECLWHEPPTAIVRAQA